MKKQTVFKIIAVLLPLILVLLFETILRIVGYGNDYKLFHRISIENKPDYLEMNKNIAGKYFKDNGLRSDNQSDLFLKTKTDSTFRVFVQGASTVVGFPFYRAGSFPRLLKHRLAFTFPEKNIEVVNTGITAVNSYTLWDLTDAIIEQKPDLVLIYAGHNEYYGALGVGSSVSYGNHPSIIRTYLRLKPFRFFQLLENSYRKLASKNANQLTTDETTLMEVMVGEQRIPLNSQVYQDGLTQYESNLNSILKKYKNHGIPVIIATVVSNEKDIKPFISDSILNKDQFLRDLELGNPKANKVAQSNALAAYEFGRYYLDKNQDTAKKYLHLAKELDYLRFRAPEKINDIIKNLSEKHQIPLVDMEDVFLEHSTHKVIGDDLMTEHVHPNVKGQFLMADAFYNKMKDLELIDEWNHYIPYSDAFNDIPVTEIDSLQGKLVIEDLKKSWPYDLKMTGSRPMATYMDPSLTYEERMAQDIYKKMVTWDQVMAQSYKRYESDKDFRKGLKVAQSLIFEYPEQGEVYRMAGAMCLNMGDLNKAEYYFYRYNFLEKSSASAQQLASVYIKLNKMDLARKTLSEAQKRGLNVPPLNDMVEAEIQKEEAN